PRASHPRGHQIRQVEWLACRAPFAAAGLVGRRGRTSVVWREGGGQPSSCEDRRKTLQLFLFRHGTGSSLRRGHSAAFRLLSVPRRVESILTELVTEARIRIFWG